VNGLAVQVIGGPRRRFEQLHLQVRCGTSRRGISLKRIRPDATSRRTRSSAKSTTGREASSGSPRVGINYAAGTFFSEQRTPDIISDLLRPAAGAPGPTIAARHRSALSPAPRTQNSSYREWTARQRTAQLRLITTDEGFLSARLGMSSLIERAPRDSTVRAIFVSPRASPIFFVSRARRSADLPSLRRCGSVSPRLRKPHPL